MKHAVLLCAMVLLVGASCGGSSGAGNPTSANGSGGTILVVAAADLRFAFEELAPVFERQCDCSVELSFGSSGNFTTQIEGGLQADAFFSANASFVNSLESKGLTLKGTNQLYAIGRIVLAKNKSVSASIETLDDLLDPDIKRIAIANPAHAPYGVAAQEALTSAGIWERVRPRLVLGENASQATQWVETGDAQAGILPLSLAIRLTDKLDYTVIDEAAHSPLNQGAAVIKTSQNPGVASDFLEFVNSTEGRVIMAKYGFEPPH